MGNLLGFFLLFTLSVILIRVLGIGVKLFTRFLGFLLKSLLLFILLLTLFFFLWW